MLSPVVRKVTLKTSKLHDYGLSFLCVHHDNGPVYINGIAAGVNDTLALGDRVLSVNSVSCKMMNRDMFEEKLRTKTRVVLEVQTDQDGYHQAKMEYHQRIQLTNDDVKTVEIYRPEASTPLGLTLLADPDIPGPVYVGGVALNSAAARAGVTKGHRVVTVNGQDTRMVLEEVLQSAINSSPDVLRLGLYFEAVSWHTAFSWDPNEQDSEDELDMDDELYPLQDFMLYKESGKFRLNLLSSSTQQVPGVYISVVLNTRARDEGLRRGCRIISIDGEDVSTAEKSHVIGLLGRAEHSVHIVVKDDPVNFAKFGEYTHVPASTQKAVGLDDGDLPPPTSAANMSTFSSHPQTAETSVPASFDHAGSISGAPTINQDQAVSAILATLEESAESEAEDARHHPGSLQRAGGVDLDSRRQSHDAHSGPKESVL